MTRNNIIPLHRATELPAEWYAEHLQIDRWPSSGPARHIVIGDAECAMPQAARAGRPSARAVLRRLGNSATIAIAVFCVVWFGGQLIRGWLS